MSFKFGLSGAATGNYDADFDPHDLGGGVAQDLTNAVGESFEAASKSWNRSNAEEAPQDAPAPPTPPTANDEWYDTPTFKNQLSGYPDLCKILGPKFKVFDLTADEERLNEFMEGTYPEEAPSIVIQSIDKEFAAGSENWKMLVTYFKVKYRKILTTANL